MCLNNEDHIKTCETSSRHPSKWRMSGQGGSRQKKALVWLLLLVIFHESVNRCIFVHFAVYPSGFSSCVVLVKKKKKEKKLRRPGLRLPNANESITVKVTQLKVNNTKLWHYTTSGLIMRLTVLLFWHVWILWRHTSMFALNHLN